MAKHVERFLLGKFTKFIWDAKVTIRREGTVHGYGNVFYP